MPTEIITPEALNANLSNPEWVIFDCRFSLNEPEAGFKQYQCGHIPGAQYADLNKDLSSPIKPDSGRHPLPEKRPFQKFLMEKGVSNRSTIVVYDDNNYAFAARFWWLLKYFGFDDIKILEKGYQNWINSGYSIEERTCGKPLSQNLHLEERHEMKVTKSQVEHRQSDCKLVDCREPARFNGEVEPIDPRAGHISGAENFCWLNCLNENGEFKNREDLFKHWSKYDATKTIVYCGSGVTACVVLLSQELTGIPPSTLYVGGWSEWLKHH